MISSLISTRVNEQDRRYYSPLRYPGGKARLASLLREVLRTNGLLGGMYAEPYAGGAGLALALLFDGFASKVHINDLDPAIYSIWFSILEKTDEFCQLIQDTPLTPTEWHRQRRIYSHAPKESALRLGFAAFFLNRTNRSGIIDSGSMIGGLQQDGEWTLDARYNRSALVRRVQRIARYRRQIRISRLDAVDFLLQAAKTLPSDSLIYLDPPYYTRGRRLYANYYEAQDHSKVSEILPSLPYHWVISYDNIPAVRRLYRGYRRRSYTLHYTAAERRRGEEVMFFSPNLTVPKKACELIES